MRSRVEPRRIGDRRSLGVTVSTDDSRRSDVYRTCTVMLNDTGAHRLGGHGAEYEITVGGVASALLVAYQYMADLGVRRQPVVQRQYHAAGEAEDRVHADALQRLQDDISAAEFHGFIRKLLRDLLSDPL